MNRELRRVKWHVGKPLVKDFVVVIIFGLILAAILYGVDFGFLALVLAQ